MSSFSFLSGCLRGKGTGLGGTVAPTLANSVLLTYTGAAEWGDGDGAYPVQVNLKDDMITADTSY